MLDPENVYGALVSVREIEQTFDERRFSGAVYADQAEQLAFAYAKASSASAACVP